MGRHSFDRSPGPVQRCTCDSVQPLPERRRQVVVDRIPHQLVPERQSLADLAEQSGSDRRCARGATSSTGVRPATAASSAAEKVPRIDASRSSSNVSSGSSVSRRKTVRRKLGGNDARERPRRDRLAPRSRRRPRVPAAARSRRAGCHRRHSTWARSAGPAGRPTTRQARSVTSSIPNGPSTTCCAPRSTKSLTVCATSTAWDPLRSVTRRATGRRVRCRTIACTARSVSGSAHCRSSSAIGDRTGRGEVLEHIEDCLHDHPTGVGRAERRCRHRCRSSERRGRTGGPVPQQPGQLDALLIWRAPLHLERLGQRSQRTILLDLVARAAEHAHAAVPGELECCRPSHGSCRSPLRPR